MLSDCTSQFRLSHAVVTTDPSISVLRRKKKKKTEDSLFFIHMNDCSLDTALFQKQHI